MKKITLHGPAMRNGGGYIGAGETVDVGGKASEIALDRAQKLVSARAAVPAPEAPTSKSATKAS